MNTHPLISFLLATYNERETIVDLIKRITTALTAPIEIIIVDDNSSDGTVALITALNDSRLKIIRRTRCRGLASAYLRAIIESRGEILCWMDADGCMPPEMIPSMIEKLNDYDAVVGSRFAVGGSDNRDKIRVWASILINGFARRLLGCQTRDIDSGFMVMKRACLDIPLFTPRSGGEYFIEMIAALEHHGYKIMEMGFPFRDRNKSEGQSKSYFNLCHFLYLGMKYGLRTIRTWLYPLSCPRKLNGEILAPPITSSTLATLPTTPTQDAIEIIKHNDTVLAMIVRTHFPPYGLSFITPDDFSQQLAYMRHPAEKVIQPHLHNLITREVHFTKEVLYLVQGKVRVDFYDNEKQLLENRVLVAGDLILLSEGGHGFTMLEETVMFEIKQGPYAGDADKTKF